MSVDKLQNNDSQLMHAQASDDHHYHQYFIEQMKPVVKGGGQKMIHNEHTRQCAQTRKNFQHPPSVF
jgi:hypothetical protein